MAGNTTSVCVFNVACIRIRQLSLRGERRHDASSTHKNKFVLGAPRHLLPAMKRAMKTQQIPIIILIWNSILNTVTVWKQTTFKNKTEPRLNIRPDFWAKSRSLSKFPAQVVIQCCDEQSKLGRRVFVRLKLDAEEREFFILKS